MKNSFLFFCFSAFLLQGCSLKSREESLSKREGLIQQREQELLLKEKTLQLKEEELNIKQQLLDSVSVVDTASSYNAQLIGVWNVEMICTETTCPGSAVGDAKTETWEIGYQDNNIIAQAKVNNELVRVYSGTYSENTLELTATVERTADQPSAKITTRLRLVNDSGMEGQREIERDNQCKIVYSMQMDRK